MKLNTYTTTAMLLILTACGGMPDKVSLLEDARNYVEQARNLVVDEDLDYNLVDAKIALAQAEQAQDTRDIQQFTAIAIEKSQLVIAANKQPTEYKAKNPQVRIPATQTYATAEGTIFILPSPSPLDELQYDVAQTATIAQIVQLMRQYPNRQAIIEGYAAGRIDTDFKRGIIYRQANKVRFALMRHGIASNRLIIKGLVNPSSINHAQAQHSYYVRLMLPN